MRDEMRNNNTQSGRSMIEMLGFMSVAMVLMASVSKLIMNAYGQYKMSTASIQISDLAGVITKAAALDVDYKETVNKINSGDEEYRKLIPSSFRIRNSSDRINIFHVFGGKVEIGLGPDAASGGPDATKLSIKFYGLTRTQCIELAMKDWINNKVASLDTVVVNENNYWYWPVYHERDDTSFELPVYRSAVAGIGDAEDEKGQCNKERGNTITWVFN